MKISVLGAGALGSMIGGLLKHHAPDVDVLLIGRGPHAQTMIDSGNVVLEGPWGSRRAPVRASLDVADVRGSDYVLLTVKSQATEDAVKTVLPFLGDAIVVSIQNGLNQERLSRHLPTERLLVGVNAGNVLVSEPGTVRLQLAGATMIGPSGPKQEMATAEAICRILCRTGFRFLPCVNVLPYQCNKLAINAVGYAASMSNSNLVSEALTDADWRSAVGLPILEECREAFRLEGVALKRIPGAPTLAELRSFIRWLQMPIVSRPICWAVRMFYRKPILFSLGRDILHKNTTEVEYINGEIVRMLRRHGREAFANEKVVQLVRQLEKRADGSFFALDDVTAEFLPYAGKSATAKNSSDYASQSA